MKNFLWTGIALGVSILLGCDTNTVDSERSKYLSLNCLSEDSIINEYTQNYKNLEYSVISRAVTRFYVEGKIDKANKILSSVSQMPELKTDSKLQAFHYIDLGFYYLWSQEFDSARVFIEKREKLPLIDTQNYLTLYNLKGSYYYSIQEIDSARNQFFNGYILATDWQKLNYIERFSVNLGAIAFSQNQYGTAVGYFSNAYKAMKKQGNSNLVLANNLTASLLQEEKLDKAYEIIEPYFKKLKSTDTNYNSQLTRLNYIQVLEAQGNWDAAKLVLIDLERINIFSSLQTDFLASYLKYYRHLNWNGFKDFYRTRKEEFDSQWLNLLNRHGQLINELVQKFPDLFSNFKSYLSNSDLNIGSHGKYHLHNLAANYFELHHEFNSELYHRKTAQKYYAEYNSLNDSIRLADIENSIAIVELEDRLEKSESQLRYSSQLLSYQKGIIGALAIIAIVLIALGYYIYTNRTQKIKYSELLLESKSKEAAFLEEEKKLNSRILTLSKMIIEKSKELATKIKNGPYSNEPEIFQVQKELEQMALTDQVVQSTPELRVFENEYPFIDEIEEFKNLAESKKRILILSVENYRPKEIATTLNLSYAYVRNVQTDLRKILKENNFTEFRELKK